jgi:4-hydroxybenzoate polyprenyltransferase
MSAKPVPLFVDLDATLTVADVTVETMFAYATSGLRPLLQLICWLTRGRAFAKAMVARRMPVDPATLPWKQATIDAIKAARAHGRPVILASASHKRNITRVARHLGLFDAIIASTAKDNAKGKGKLTRILAMTNGGPFDYIGDAPADIPIWSAAREGISVGYCPPGVTRLGDAPKSKLRALAKAMRPHQWAKNALIFVPLGTAGLLTNVAALGRAGLALLLFSLVASGVYLINDTFDIESDRKHATKHTRPLAAGTITVPFALGVALLLISLPIVAGWWALGGHFATVLTGYLVLTSAYSVRLKAVMTLDVITLACLYTIRIFAGAVAVSVTVSFWLLAFSVFLFLSLAYLKRYTELASAKNPEKLLSGRGYLPADLDIVAMAGVSSGMVSILVLALFSNAMRESNAYKTPEVLWLLCILLLYWINRVWMMARRGEVEGDPVAFATKDPRSIMVAALMGVVVLVAQTIRIG